jgi:hypothetical protein
LDISRLWFSDPEKVEEPEAVFAVCWLCGDISRLWFSDPEKVEEPEAVFVVC